MADLTAPFRSEAADLIGNKAEHLFGAVAFPVSGEEIPLDVTDVSIGFDEAWVPHIQANMTCALPDAATLELLDARKGCRVQITVGYRYGKDDEESVLLADLHLRSRTVKHDSGEMTLELASDERLLQEFILFGTEVLSRKDINNFVGDVLELSYPGFPFKLRSSFREGAFAEELKGDPVEVTAHGTVTSEGTELTPILGKSAWTLLDEAQRRTGTWIYSPDGRDWMITNRAEISSTPALTLTIGENGTILAGESTLSRTDFFNEVVLRYEWDSPKIMPAKQWEIGIARITGGPFSVAAIGRNTYVEVIDRRANKAEANKAATDKLTRSLTHGHEYTVQAVAAYWLQAGDTVALNIDGKTEKLLVKSVNFSPAEGTMALVLRKPEIATISNEL